MPTSPAALALQRRARYVVTLSTKVGHEKTLPPTSATFGATRRDAASQGPSDAAVASESHLREIADILREMWVNRCAKNADRARAAEWGLVAMVTDRLLFVIFILLTVGTSVAILSQRPDYTVTETPPAPCMNLA